MSYFSNSMRYMIKSILTPPARAYESFIDWIESLLAPLQDYFNEFATHDELQRARVRFNGQVIVMRAALNYLTNRDDIEIVVNRRSSEGFFYLESETSEAPQYLFIETEAEPLYSFFLEESDAAFTFVIKVPAPLTNAQRELIQSEVDTFGLPIQNYTILEV